MKDNFLLNYVMFSFHRCRFSLLFHPAVSSSYLTMECRRHIKIPIAFSFITFSLFGSSTCDAMGLKIACHALN